MLAMLLLAALAEPVFTGRWEGSVQIPGLELPLVLDLDRDSAGRWVGSATAPDRGVKGAPLVSIEVHDKVATFALKGALGDPKFEAHLDSGGKLLGDFHQGGHAAPFTLRFAGPPQVDPPRQSTPVRKEMEGEWTGEFPFNNRAIRANLTLKGSAAKLKLVGRREFDIPIDFVSEDGGFLSLESSETRIVLELRFDTDKHELRGLFRQGPADTPLALHKK